MYLEKQENQRLFQFLMGLNETYTSIRSHTLLLNPLPTVNQAYSSLIQEENQRGIWNYSMNESLVESIVLNSSTPLLVKVNQRRIGILYVNIAVPEDIGKIHVVSYMDILLISNLGRRDWVKMWQPTQQLHHPPMR